MSLIYYIVLVSRVQQSDSVIHKYEHIHILSKNYFLFYSVLQCIEYSSLCSTVGPWCLTPSLSLPSFPLGNHKFVFSVCESIFVL